MTTKLEKPPVASQTTRVADMPPLEVVTEGIPQKELIESAPAAAPLPVAREGWGRRWALALAGVMGLLLAVAGLFAYLQNSLTPGPDVAFVPPVGYEVAEPVASVYPGPLGGPVLPYIPYLAIPSIPTIADVSIAPMPTVSPMPALSIPSTLDIAIPSIPDLAIPSIPEMTMPSIEIPAIPQAPATPVTSLIPPIEFPTIPSIPPISVASVRPFPAISIPPFPAISIPEYSDV